MVMKFRGGRRRLKIFQIRENGGRNLEAKAMKSEVHARYDISRMALIRWL